MIAMRHIKNFFYKFMAGFYMDMRGLFSTDLLFNHMKVIEYDLKMQKWEGKIK